MRLAAYLKMSKRTATDLAGECGVSIAQMTRVAKGTADPSLDLIRRIRAATSGAVSADDFLTPFEDVGSARVAVAAN